MKVNVRNIVFVESFIIFTWYSITHVTSLQYLLYYSCNIASDKYSKSLNEILIFLA